MTRLQKLKWLYLVGVRQWCPDPTCRGGIDPYDHNPNRDHCTNCTITGRQMKYSGWIGLTKPFAEIWKELDDVPFQSRVIGVDSG